MKILVVGGINIDYVNYVYDFPKHGESIKTIDFLRNIGGKAVNQAISIKRLSENKDTEVSIFGKANIKQKEELMKIFNSEGINHSNLLFTNKDETGTAIIVVSKLEENNEIIMNGGANDSFSESDVSELNHAIMKHDVIVMQFETNRFLIEKTIELCKIHNKTLFVNATPINKLKNSYFDGINWLIFKKIDFESFLNKNIHTIRDIKKGITEISHRYKKNLLIDLEDDGVYIHTHKLSKHIPIKKKKVVDITSAGDALIGGFIQGYKPKMSNNELIRIIELGMKASLLAKKRLGAFISIPTYDEVRKKDKHE